MSMELQPVDIEVFGRSIRVNCPEEQKEDLHKAAEELTERLQNFKLRTKFSGTEQLVLVLALNLCYELTQEKAKARSFASRIDEGLILLQKKIDDALSSHVLTSKKSIPKF